MRSVEEFKRCRQHRLMQRFYATQDAEEKVRLVRVIRRVCFQDYRKTRDDEENWISTEAGAHILINENGEAVSGPMKGQTFSEAKSEPNESKASESGKAVEGSTEGQSASEAKSESSEETTTEPDAEANKAASKPKKQIGVSRYKREGNTINVTSDLKIKNNGGAVVIKAGTAITDIQDFAGKGCKRKIDVESHLVEQYGGKPGEWTKAKGQTQVAAKNGKTRDVEVHWFENPDVGQVDMKVKRYIKKSKG